MPIIPRIVMVLGLVAVSFVGMPPAGFAQLVSPFGDDTAAKGLANEDRELMRKAMRDVLEKYTVGAAETWDSPTSGRQGRAVLTKTFEKGGMRCAQVTHQFTKGPGATYTAPMCKTADGSWKLAY
jgi:surface antigen